MEPTNIPPISTSNIPYENEPTITDIVSLENTTLPQDLGPTEKNPSIQEMEKGASKAATKEGVYLSKIGHWVLRSLAGVAGGSLFAIAAVVGGGLTLAAGLPIFLVAAPPALVGAAIGAILSPSDAKEGAREGAKLGAIIGAFILLFPVGLVPAGIVIMSKFLVYSTLGMLGAGLCAFAATGKSEAEQLTELQPFDKEGKELREKSEYEKLLDMLCIISYPFLVNEDEFILESYRDPNKEMLSKQIGPGF